MSTYTSQRERQTREQIITSAILEAHSVCSLSGRPARQPQRHTTVPTMKQTEKEDGKKQAK